MYAHLFQPIAVAVLGIAVILCKNRKMVSTNTIYWLTVLYSEACLSSLNTLQNTNVQNLHSEQILPINWLCTVFRANYRSLYLRVTCMEAAAGFSCIIYSTAIDVKCKFNPLTAKLFNWNFHPLEAVSR